MVFPECLQLDLFEMQFHDGLDEILDGKGAEDEINGKLRYLSLDEIMKLKPEAEAIDMQLDMLNTTMLNVVTETSTPGGSNEAAVMKVIDKLSVFFSPFPLLPAKKMSGMKFPLALADDLLDMRLALQASKTTTRDEAKRVHDVIFKIQNSKSEFFKTFTAVGAGRRVVGVLKQLCAEQAACGSRSCSMTSR